MAKRKNNKLALQKYANQIASTPLAGHIQGNHNTTNNNTMDKTVLHLLLKTQRDQIKFLQSALLQSNERIRELNEQLALGKTTLETTLVYLSKTCQECFDLHKTAHKKLDKVIEEKKRK